MTTIWTALSKAQAEMKNAPLNSVNPHFKSRYADLAAIRDTVMPVLTKHGLALTQTTQYQDGVLVLHTTLWGPDGAKIESTYPLPIDKPQVMGSGMTYARRYTLAAIAGISAEEDDDANAAQEGAKPKAPQKKESESKPTTGEPRMIAVELDANEETDWIGWCATMKATLNAAPDEVAVRSWWAANSAPLGNLQIYQSKKLGKVGEKFYAALEKLRDDRIATLKEETLVA